MNEWRESERYKERERGGGGGGEERQGAISLSAHTNILHYLIQLQKCDLPLYISQMAKALPISCVCLPTP